MGLTLAGSIAWLAALAAAFALPAGLAWLSWHWHRRRLPDRDAFLLRALPLAYATLFLAHGALGELVVAAGRRAADGGSPVDVVLTFAAVLVADAALVLMVLAGLARWLARRRREVS